MNRVILSVFALGIFAIAGGPASLASSNPCQNFASTYNYYNNIATNNGYWSMQQPLASTQAQSNAILSQMESFFASAQAGLSPYASCPGYSDVEGAFVAAQQQIAQMAAYTGPWGTPETALSSQYSAALTNYFELPLPCYQDGSKPNGLRPCSQVIQDFTTKLSAQVQQMTILDYEGGGTLALGGIQSNNSSQPVCVPFDPFTGVANTSSETSNEANHSPNNGISCGTFTQYTTHTSGTTCVGDGPATPGTLPQAQVMGMMPRARDCNWAQMQNEIKRGVMRLSAATGTDPHQVYQAFLYGGTITVNGQTQTTTGILTQQQNLISAYNVSDIEQCNQADVSSATVASSGTGFNSSCHLQAQRQMLESEYLNLARYEMSERSQRAYERFYMGTQGMDIFTAFQLYMQSNPKNGKRSQCNGGMYTAYVTTSWNNFFPARANSVWYQGVCQ